MTSTNPWAHIDQLRARLAAEKKAAVEKLKELKFKGSIEERLEFDGQDWRFPVSGETVKSRTLDGLIEKITSMRGGLKKEPEAQAKLEPAGGR